MISNQNIAVCKIFFKKFILFYRKLLFIAQIAEMFLLKFCMQKEFSEGMSFLKYMKKMRMYGKN